MIRKAIPVDHPQLRKAAVTAEIDIGRKAWREGQESDARVHLLTALRLMSPGAES